MSRRSFVLSLLIMVGVIQVSAIGCSSSSISEGTSFKNEAEFKKASAADGFVIIGSFNLGWPATISSLTDGQNEIRISIPEIGDNEYNGLTGYKLKAVVLKRDDGKYSGIVLRAKDKS